MAEIKEVVKDTTNKIKKEFKKKPVFYTALIIVVIFALYKWLTASEYSDETVTNAYVPVGYDGYPEISDSMLEDYEELLGGMGSGSLVGDGNTIGGSTSSGTVNGDSSSYVEDSYIYDSTYEEYLKELRKENAELMDYLEYLESLQTPLPEMMDNSTLYYDEEGDLYDAVTGALIYSDTKPYQVLLGDSAAEKAQLELEKQSNLAWRNDVIAQMQANSAAWGSASAEEKIALNEANKKLAQGIGAIYNEATGKWTEQDGTPLYKNTSTSSNKTPSTSTTSTTKTSGGVSYDPKVDYAQKIKDAKASGASESVIKTLEAQREAKKAGEGLDDYGNKINTSSSSSSAKSASQTSTTSNKNSSSGTSTSSTTKLNGKTVTKTVTMVGNKKTTTYTDSRGKVVAQNSTTVKK